MDEQKIDENINNKDFNQPEGLNTDTVIEFLIKMFNEEFDSPLKFFKHDCDRYKLCKSK